MLSTKRSPGPPWLPVAPFANRACLLRGEHVFGADARLVATLAFVDRTFSIVGLSAWTSSGNFGNAFGAGYVVVPSTAEWFAVAGSLLSAVIPTELRPWNVFRVRWELHL